MWMTGLLWVLLSGDSLPSMYTCSTVLISHLWQWHWFQRNDSLTLISGLRRGGGLRTRGKLCFYPELTYRGAPCLPFTKSCAVLIWGLPASEVKFPRPKESGGWRNFGKNPGLPGQANPNNPGKQKFAWTWAGCLDGHDCTQVWPCTSFGLCLTCVKESVNECLSLGAPRNGSSFPDGGVVKNPFANAGDTRDVGSIPQSGRSPGAGKSNLLQYSCLENSTDRGAWWGHPA